ncbi:MAG: 7-cyano-7-deazaguanine synthase [Thermoplasmata archaeon]
MKVVSLISGGIDSPVATYLMLKKDLEVIALHLDNRPFTDEKQMNKTIAQVEKLKEVTKKEIKTYVVPHGDNQLEFAKNCKRNLECVLCRRMMLRIAEKISEKEGAFAIVTGESLGQVASQTLRNIKVESQAINIQVIRPLIGFDKIEIEAIAKKIGTYEISILPGLCCTIVPDKPSTAAHLYRVLDEEKKIDIDAMLESCVKKAVVMQ